MGLLVKGARIIDCCHDFIGDVYIEEGKIKEIGAGLIKDCKTIEGEGLVLLPSFIDLHAHFRDPGLTYKEDIESGSRAAVRGGYTAVNLMANTKPVCSTMDTVEYVIEKAQKVGLVDVHQCVSITRDFNGEDISHLDNIGHPVRFISDDGKGVLKDKVMLKAMEKAKSMGFSVISHAENEDITPIDTRLSENIMTVRDIVLAKHTSCHLHLAHVSTKEAMEEIVNAKLKGFNITCEVMPHNLALTDDVVYKVNPPLRKYEDVKYLINAIKDGYVDVIATDHAPHSSEDKAKGISGISGIEIAFSVCYTTLVRNGHITLNELSKLMSKNPSEIMGYKKGRIEIGYDGDLALVDIGRKYRVDASEFASRGKNTPFDGMEFYGKVIMTIKGGNTVYSEEAGYDN